MRKVLYLMGILNDGDVEWLSNAGEVRRMKAGSLLIQIHVPTEWLYIVLEGHVAVLLEGGGELARLGQGEVLGEISFLDSRPPSASVAALDDTHVLALRREKVTERLEADPGFAARFYRSIGMLLADRLRATSGQLGYMQAAPGRARAMADNPADELDDTWTENISFAAARFHQLLRNVGVAP